jgi:hypothetical protein
MLEGDEAAVFRLRLMSSFLKLKSRARREQLVALAERMAQAGSKYPVEPGD